MLSLLFYVVVGDALHDLVPFVQFKKRENAHGVVLLFKSTTLLKQTLLHACFLRFLNCANDTKSRKTSDILRYSCTGI